MSRLVMIACLLACFASDVPAQSGSKATAQVAPVVPPLTRLTVGQDVVLGNPAFSYYGSAVWRDGDLLAWQNGMDSSIWFCKLNPQTGDMIPSDGRGTFVATGASYVGNILLKNLTGLGQIGTYNGPEWGQSQEGLGIYFTVTDKKGVYQQAKGILSSNNSKVTVQQFTSGGNENRFANLPALNPSDTKTRVGFFQVPPNFSTGGAGKPLYPTYWQFDQPGQPQNRIPLDVLSFNGPRWIAGEPSLLTFVTAPDQTVQVAKFNTDTGQLTFLTTGPQIHFDAEIATDPVSGKKFMTAIENNNAVAVYEFNAGSWQKTRTITPAGTDPDKVFVFAVKPLVVRGNLVCFFNVLANSSFGCPVDIYVATGNGAVNQNITNGGLLQYCLNPQYYIGAQDNKVFLYYYTSLPAPVLDLFSAFRRISFVVE
jgi:hypothetical protein